jgi:hypothetical protein
VVNLPPDPIQSAPTYAAALTAFEALPSVRVLFDNGAGSAPDSSSGPGDPIAGYAKDFSAFPVPGTAARTWYLGAGGTLNATAATTSGASSFTADARALPLTDFGPNTGSGGLWGNASQWQWNWQQNPAGTSVSFVTAPLTETTTVLGSGAVHLWVRSSTPDVDLQATISEVRPDGQETFVQDGWIRASERKLPLPCQRASSSLWPSRCTTKAMRTADARGSA